MRILASAILFTAISVTAAATDLPREIQWRSLPVYLISRALYDDNPAAMTYRDTLSLSLAYASVSACSMDSALVPQTGRGHLTASVAAKSYQHIDTRSTVWGGATFAYGRLRDIRWSDCVDYQLVAPYVLGDAVGGDLTFRRYALWGGYSRSFGDKWTLGASLGYRAEIAWRDVDPRVKTIVSDINVNLGASCRYTADRIAGVSAAIRSYSQNCDLDFYNPLNDINTVPLTGLGTYYQRFAGNTNKSSGHGGIGYTLCAQWLTLDSSGLQLGLRADGIRISEQLRNFNNITLAYTDTYHYTASACYGAVLSPRVRMLPTLSGTYMHRKGTENLFGTAAGASYDKIGSRSPYRHNQTVACLKVPVEVSTGHGYLTLTPSAGYYDSDESMSAPALADKSRSISPGMAIDYSHLTHSQWLWVMSADCSRRRDLCSDCLVNAGLSVSAPVGGYMLAFSAKYQCISYTGTLGTSRLAAASVNIIF